MGESGSRKILEAWWWPRLLGKGIWKIAMSDRTAHRSLPTTAGEAPWEPKKGQCWWEKGQNQTFISFFSAVNANSTASQTPLIWELSWRRTWGQGAGDGSHLSTAEM